MIASKHLTIRAMQHHPQLISSAFKICITEDFITWKLIIIYLSKQFQHHTTASPVPPSGRACHHSPPLLSMTWHKRRPPPAPQLNMLLLYFWGEFAWSRVHCWWQEFANSLNGALQPGRTGASAHSSPRNHKDPRARNARFIAIFPYRCDTTPGDG